MTGEQRKALACRLTLSDTHTPGQGSLRDRFDRRVRDSGHALRAECTKPSTHARKREELTCDTDLLVEQEGARTKFKICSCTFATNPLPFTVTVTVTVFIRLRQPTPKRSRQTRWCGAARPSFAKYRRPSPRSGCTTSPKPRSAFGDDFAYINQGGAALHAPTGAARGEVV